MDETGAQTQVRRFTVWSWLFPFIDIVCPRVSDFTSLQHSFLLWEAGMIIPVLASERCEDRVRQEGGMLCTLESTTQY